MSNVLIQSCRKPSCTTGAGAARTDPGGLGLLDLHFPQARLVQRHNWQRWALAWWVGLGCTPGDMAQGLERGGSKVRKSEYDGLTLREMLLLTVSKLFLLNLQ